MLSIKSVLIILSFAALLLQGSTTYKVVGRYPIPGVGGFVYVLLDGPWRRAFVLHASQVAVLGADIWKPVGTITDTPGVQGVGSALAFKPGVPSEGRGKNVS